MYMDTTVLPIFVLIHSCLFSTVFKTFVGNHVRAHAKFWQNNNKAIMKISRFKKSQKILKFFTANFQYHEPYLVLVDATFCQTALQNKVNIEEQIKKYFQNELRLITTQCIILEAESLGGPLVGATKIVKQFQVHKCGHEGKPVSAVECIKSMTKTARYIVASQDRTLQESLRKVPGRCLLYLHHATPVLEEASAASKKWVAKKFKQLLEPAIPPSKVASEKQVNEHKVKFKKKKNPNPLSCKKSKKQKNQQKQQQNMKISNKSKPAFKQNKKNKSKN